jgi:hypothetical protein
MTVACVLLKVRPDIETRSWRVFGEGKCRNFWGQHYGENPDGTVKFMSVRGGHWEPLDLKRPEGNWPTLCNTCGEMLVPRRFTLEIRPAYQRPDGTILDMRKTLPGDMYFAPWKGMPKSKDRYGQLIQNTMLSPLYMRAWATKRSPICVITPNGGEWCVDYRSEFKDFPGWMVQGEPPNLTCVPDVEIPGIKGPWGRPAYRGQLVAGVFSENML